MFDEFEDEAFDRYEDDGYKDPESDETEEEIEPEETLEELDIDERGHVRPRRRKSRFDEYGDVDVFDPENPPEY